MIRKNFFRELGRFLYAIAMSDGVIQERETGKLDKAILDELETMKGERSEIILAKLSFYNCIQEHIPQKKAAESFIHFLEKYSPMITDAERGIAVRLIRRISLAYGGKNEGEVGLEELAKRYLDN